MAWGGLPPSGLTLGALPTGTPGQLHTGMWPLRAVAVVVISHWADDAPSGLRPRVQGVGLFLCPMHLLLGPTLVLGTSVVSAGVLALGEQQGLPASALLTAVGCPASLPHALCSLPGTPDHRVGSKMPTGSGPRVTLRTPLPCPQHSPNWAPPPGSTGGLLICILASPRAESSSECSCQGPGWSSGTGQCHPWGSGAPSSMPASLDWTRVAHRAPPAGLQG